MIAEFASPLLPIDASHLEIANFIVSLCIMTVAFALIYKILPDARIAWPDVWAGAVAAALLFTVGKTLIGFYLARATVASPFGAAGSLAILLLWVYYSAQIFLLCGEFTQVYARRRGAGIVPDENAVRVVKSYLRA
jgi:membrane protein